MATVVERASNSLEQSYPWLVAAVCGGLSLALNPGLFAALDAHKWNISNMYNAVFTLATVFTAFLFSFYTFIITTESGFIGRMKRSIYYKGLITYTLSAIKWAGALTVLSLPVVVIVPCPTLIFSWENFIAAVWVAVTVGSTCAFYRATHIFAIFARPHH